ncbi:MAG: prolyl oligopeptidase family serine peptidase [Bacteroidota bacterium]
MFNQRKYIAAIFFSLVSMVFSSALQHADAQSLPQYLPDQNEIAASYKKTALLDSLARNSVFKTNINARWLKDNKRFWYKNLVAANKSEYVLVDAVKNTKEPAFDHVKMASIVSKLADTILVADNLPITNMEFDDDHKLLFIEVRKNWYKINTNTYEGSKHESIKTRENRPVNSGIKSRWQRQWESDSISPNKQYVVSIKNGNVFVRSITSAQTIQYTKDADTLQPYGLAQWSPDSKHLVVFRIKPVEEKPVYFLLSSVDTTTRAVLKSNRYAQPGDPFTSYEMFTINIGSADLVKTKTEIYDFLDFPWIHWRYNDNRFFVFEKADRGHQRFRMIEVDASNGDTRNLVDEKTNTFIYESRIFTWYVKNTNEVIWTSEKDGWNQLYLVDAVKGGIKNRITKGNWVVRNIDSIDEKKREIWFQASGVNPGEDPYNIHYYRIGFDGKNMVAITSANANHRLSFSADRTFFIDNYSRPDLPPVAALHRTKDGKLIRILETADLSIFNQLQLRMPEVFVAKARDGLTDIWGIVCRPVDFDSTKMYPVIENIYAGPQDAFVPKSFMSYSEMQSMASLGFIVVQCDGMGTANRSKSFHDVAWKNLADAGLPDRILWTKALAKKYPYVDTSRVGLYGTSAGGQNSTGALLFHPEFYKAAVSASACHDNRIDKQWWNEQWMGYPVGPHYAAQSNITNAAKLKGALMMIVGEADTNVPPESTYRMADALIKAGKTFDLLVMPGMGHSDGGPYGRKRKRDFFVKHLLQVDPPDRNKDISAKY